MSEFITPIETLEELIDEGTVDCYDEYEQKSGMMCSVEMAVECPFEAKVIGEKVIVTKLKEDEELMAVCEKNGKSYEINIDSLEFIKPYPNGYEWIEAYQLFKEQVG
ncbi:hypothetical protein BH10ACI1_BH10ACI1_32320 [soil metagenome]